MKTEKEYKPISGYLALLVMLAIIAVIVYGSMIGNAWVISVNSVILLLWVIGFTVVNPNESKVLVLFGAYKGTIRKNGFFWVNPFFVKKKI